MRLTRQSVTVASGAVLICDPQLVADVESSDAAVFRLWQGNGEFKVYSDGNTFFVDVDPRVFRVKSRPTLSLLSGRVGIDTSHIGIYDFTEDRKHSADDALADGWAIAIEDLDKGEYCAWFEEKGTSKDIFRGVIGFGPEPVMLLNGDYGSQLQAIEDRIARAYRMKGVEKQSALKSISDSLCELHLAGCNDKRLRMMAESVKLVLPRRKNKRS